MILETLLNNATYELRIADTSSRDAGDILSAPTRSFAVLDELLTVFLVAELPLSSDVPEDARLKTLRTFSRSVDISVDATIAAHDDRADVHIPTRSDSLTEQPPTPSLSRPSSPSLKPPRLQQVMQSEPPSAQQQRMRSLSNALRSPVKSIFAAKPQLSMGQLLFSAPSTPQAPESAAAEDSFAPLPIVSTPLASSNALAEAPPTFQYTYNYNAHAAGQEPIVHAGGRCLFPLSIPIGYLSSSSAAAATGSDQTRAKLTLVLTIVQKPSSLVAVKGSQADTEWMEDGEIDNVNILSKLVENPRFAQSPPTLMVSSKTTLKAAPTVPLLRRTVQSSFAVVTPLQLTVKPVSIRLDNQSFFLELPLTLRPRDQLRLVFPIMRTEDRRVALSSQEDAAGRLKKRPKENADPPTLGTAPFTKPLSLSIAVESRVEGLPSLSEQAICSWWECVLNSGGVAAGGDPRPGSMMAKLSKRRTQDDSTAQTIAAAFKRFSISSGQRNSQAATAAAHARATSEPSTPAASYFSVPTAKMRKNESLASIVPAGDGAVLFNFKVLGTPTTRQLFGIVVHVINQTADTKSYRIRIPPPSALSPAKPATSQSDVSLAFYQDIVKRKTEQHAENALVCLDSNVKLQNIRPGGVAFAHLHFVSITPGLNYIACVELEDCETGAQTLMYEALSVWVEEAAGAEAASRSA
ncbi:hypothetical protein RI367_003595 [Sorochytrium milnesiophthora]